MNLVVVASSPHGLVAAWAAARAGHVVRLLLPPGLSLSPLADRTGEVPGAAQVARWLVDEASHPLPVDPLALWAERGPRFAVHDALSAVTRRRHRGPDLASHVRAAVGGRRARDWVFPWLTQRWGFDLQPAQLAGSAPGGAAIVDPGALHAACVSAVATAGGDVLEDTVLYGLDVEVGELVAALTDHGAEPALDGAIVDLPVHPVEAASWGEVWSAPSEGPDGQWEIVDGGATWRLTSLAGMAWAFGGDPHSAASAAQRVGARVTAPWRRIPRPIRPRTWGGPAPLPDAHGLLRVGHVDGVPYDLGATLRAVQVGLTDGWRAGERALRAFAQAGLPITPTEPLPA